MGLSSNTLLHQTDYNGLMGIIKTKGFKLSYSLENIVSNYPVNFNYAFPMVSFSDIPFSELNAHLYKYGGFSIGMKREWIIRKGFNPVCYYSKDCSVLERIIQQYNYYFIEGKGDARQNLKDNEYIDYKLFITQLAYTKNYEGYLKTKKKEYSNYRFSDEREWRFIPQIESLNGELLNFIINSDEYKNNKQLHLDDIQNPVIDFDIDDIRYIIVDKEYQIAAVKKQLYSTFVNPPDKWEQININFFTSKQIENDIFGLAHDVEVY